MIAPAFGFGAIKRNDPQHQEGLGAKNFWIKHQEFGLQPLNKDAQGAFCVDAFTAGLSARVSSMLNFSETFSVTWKWPA